MKVVVDVTGIASTVTDYGGRLQVKRGNWLLSAADQNKFTILEMSLELMVKVFLNLLIQQAQR